jgi:hypothetical protein
MQLRAVTFVLLSITIATSACAKSSSTAEEQSNAEATSAATAMTEASAAGSPAEAAASPAASVMAATPGGASAIQGIPVYPGAATQTTGGYNAGGGAGVQAVVVLSTDDSFDNVYAWYQQKLSGATSTVHIATPPTPSATFMMAAPDNKGMTSVVIGTSNGKTTITISQMKTQ